MTKEERVFYQSIGLCPICHKEKLWGDEKMCPECRAKQVNAVDIWRKRTGYKPNNARRNELRHTRIEQGICIRCGKKQATNGQMCLMCAKKQYEYKKQYLMRLAEA